VKDLNDEKSAVLAQEAWQNTFQKKEIPSEVEEIKGGGKSLDIFVANNITPSASAARRLFEAGAVTDMTDNKKISAEEKLKPGHTYKVGKHRFIKIT
jgi:tyrosyl-tRNA synthetase